VISNPRFSGRCLAAWLAGVALLLSASGCATGGPPVQEMSDARQAIEAARDAGAEDLASDELASARAKLVSAESHLRQRSFRSARRDALAALELAVEARSISEASRTNDRVEAGLP
jgi:hypothetical protein